MRVTMKKIVIAALLAMPAAAMAQAPQMAPQQQALQQTVIKLTGEGIDLQTQVIALRAQVEDLTKKLAAKEAPADPPK